MFYSKVRILPKRRVEMPTITVTVYRSGKPVKGARVALAAGLFDGVYGPEYTDYDGVAQFDVQHGQGGDVYVNGPSVAKWGASSRTRVTVNL
jgi:hypothetical protein